MPDFSGYALSRFQNGADSLSENTKTHFELDSFDPGFGKVDETVGGAEQLNGSGN